MMKILACSVNCLATQLPKTSAINAEESHIDLEWEWGGLTVEVWRVQPFPQN